MAKRFKNNKNSESREVATTGGGVPATTGGNPYLDAASDIGSSGSPFLKFSGKTGKYTWGADDNEIESGHQLAVNMESFEVGWICWKDDDVVDEVMVNVSQGGRKPGKGTLTDHGPYDDDNDGWKEQAKVSFRSIEDGEQYDFKVSSASGVNVMRGMLTSFGKLMAEHPDEVMVIEIDAETFEVTVINEKTGKKKKQTNYKPVFDIVGWMSVEELEEIVGSSDGENPEDYDGENEDDEDGIIEDGDGDDGDGEDSDPEPEEKPKSNKGGKISRGRKSKRF